MTKRLFHFYSKCLQVQIRVDDNTSPNKFTTGIIFVNVPRDLSDPVINLPASVTIEESTPQNSNVYDVDVRDDDLRVSECLSSDEHTQKPLYGMALYDFYCQLAIISEGYLLIIIND